jgi:dephospho-CoA kinase
MVSDNRDRFLQTYRQAGAGCVVLDIPLLFETGGDEICDYVIVTNAPADVIKQRALSRAGMTAEKLAGILQNQMPAADKIACADIVLDTDLPIADTKSQLDAWLKSLGLDDQPDTSDKG